MCACVRTVPSSSGKHERPRAGDPAAERFLGLGVPIPDTREALEEVTDLFEIRPGIDERTQRHVTGDAGKAVEPGDCPA